MVKSVLNLLRQFHGLDGEYGGTHEEVVIKNKNQALQIMVKEEAVEDLSEQLVEADEV